MARSTAQPLQFTTQVEQSFDIQNTEQHSHAQPLEFTVATPYQLFDINPSRKLPTDD